MLFIKPIYKLFNKKVPYYFNYPVWLIVWKPIRKFINVTVIPNIVFNKLRIIMYRLIGFKIGENVFIGMKCYMDDIEPSKTIIEDDVVVSYGAYFACHGKGQTHTPIVLKKGAYIGMRVSICSGKDGITIGGKAIVGAHSLVISNIPKNEVWAGVPAKKIKDKN